MKKVFETLRKDLTTRDNGQVVCSFDSPLYDIIRDLHDGILPHNWIFKTVRDLLDAFIEYDLNNESDFQDDISGISDGLVDVYNSDLMDWYNSGFSWYVDDAREQGLISTDVSIEHQIMVGQYHCIESIACRLFEAISNLESE